MTEKFTAIVDSQELTVRRAVLPAGVDGPMFTETAPSTLDQVDAVLKAYGLERTEGWRIRNGYAGMSLEAELVKL